MEAAEYLKKKFLDLNSNERRTISTHFTCATDKKQLQHVIDDISHFWRIETLEKAGLT